MSLRLQIAVTTISLWDLAFGSPLALPRESSTTFLNTALTIITHNDLYGPLSSRTDAALVLSQPVPYPIAQEQCYELGESLFPGQGSSVDFLEYLAYEGSNGPYWIAGLDGLDCDSISADGEIDSRPCYDSLPALCTQSAPLSNQTSVDNSSQWQTAVTTGNQTLTGFRDKYSFRFEGIRYAAQPERFTYSSPYEGSGQADALDYGESCVQGGGGSEDCLFLNIWTPYLPATGSTAETSSNLKPVMLWIHGGGFTSGSGSDPTFDGGSMVSRGDVLVVTINYRLGTLGFLALDDGVTNGNFGLADQITALEWMHEHIRDFGGDPERITIFGQSAGAASVRALLGSPKAIGKYSAAMVQSSPGGASYAKTYSEYYSIKEEVEAAATPILDATGCSSANSQLACLRSLDAEVFVNIPAVAAFLVVDGNYLTTPRLELTGQDPTAHVPVLLGHMRDDGAAFTIYPSPSSTLNSSLEENGFTLTPSTLTLFPEPSNPNKTLDIFNTTALVLTDAGFRCLAHATAYSAGKHSVFNPIYYYEFNRSYQLDYYSPNAPVCNAPPTAAHPYGDPEEEYFKCHSGELYYVFGSLAFNGLPPRDGNDIPMSQFIVDSWTAFARTGDPNPDMAFLTARGFTNTSAEIVRAGLWPQVSVEELRGKVLEYPSTSTEFDDKETEAQCNVLGLPLDYYEGLEKN